MSNKIYYVKCTTLEQRDSLLAYADRHGAADTLYRLDVKREPYVKLYKLPSRRPRVVPSGWAVCSDRSVVAGDIELTPDGFKRKIGKLWPSKSKVERKPSQLDRIEKRLELIESSLAVLRSGATLMQELDKAAADQCKTPTLDQVVEAAFDWFDSPVDNGPGSDYDHLRARLSKLFKQ